MLSGSSTGADNRVSDPHAPRSGDVLPLRPTTADGEIRLERPTLEPLTAAQETEAVVMVDMLGFEPIEVAGIVRVSPETFRVRLHRARARLREAYGR